MGMWCLDNVPYGSGDAEFEANIGALWAALASFVAA